MRLIHLLVVVALATASAEKEVTTEKEEAPTTTTEKSDDPFDILDADYDIPEFSSEQKGEDPKNAKKPVVTAAVVAKPSSPAVKLTSSTRPEDLPPPPPPPGEAKQPTDLTPKASNKKVTKAKPRTVGHPQRPRGKRPGPKKGTKRRPSPVRKPAAEPRKDRVGPIRPKLHKLPKKLPHHAHPQQKKKLPKAIKAVKQPIAKKEAPPSPPARRPQQPKVAKPKAQRRDYAAPTYEAPPKPQIIIKQAGPSKQFGWVGHGTWVPKYSVPNAFADAGLPNWNLMDGIFEAGLLYPGKPAAAPTYKAPAPKAPEPAPEQPSYNEVDVQPVYVPKAPAPQPTYKEPAPKAPEPAYAAPSTYAPPPAAEPAPTYDSPDTYSAPAPAAPAPGYSAANPFAQQPSALPAYFQQPVYQPSYSQASYNSPVTAVPAITTPATTPKPQPQYNEPAVNNDLFQNYYSQPSVPEYSASASVGVPKVSVAPASSSSDVYNVPLKVEETASQAAKPNDGEVFYIFYEDKDKDKYQAPQQNAVPVYVEETKPTAPPAVASAGPPSGTPNLFSPPSDEDIRTVYVPFENAVNVPSNIYDVAVATSFGYNPGQKPKFPSFPSAAPPKPGPSYDNPISSYDAPIYNDNYSAQRPIHDVLYREDAKNIKFQKKHHEKTRKARQPILLPNHTSRLTDPFELSTSSKQRTGLKSGKKLPYGTRLGPRKHYEILGL